MAAKAKVLATTSMTSSYSNVSGRESEKPASPQVTAAYRVGGGLGGGGGVPGGCGGGGGGTCGMPAM